MTFQETLHKVHSIINTEEDDSMLPGYMKFVHPDGRVDVIAPNGEPVIEGEVADEESQSVQ